MMTERDDVDIELKQRNSEYTLFEEISELIEQGRRIIATRANNTAIITFWHVGKRINEDILQNNRADYGKQIVSTLSTQLVERYGKNFEIRNLRRMMQFAEQFSDIEIVSTLSTQLSWSHFIELLPLKTDEARLYYANAVIQYQFGVRELRESISKKDFERKEIANLKIGAKSRVPFDTFKDPYLFDYMGLRDDYLESDLEAAILRELELFILEFGKGFAFVERQKRMIIDGGDFHLDLLFYNRHLKRLVAVELKHGKFKAEYKGKMELYLKWLDRYERKEGENEPIGLILCAEGNREQIELLEMGKDGIMVAELLDDIATKSRI